MEQYNDTVLEILTDGAYKPNRTAADTLSAFDVQYTVDVSRDAFPLLTTKDMQGFRWNSLLHEFFWFLSGDEHIRNLREHTQLWDAWADDEGRLDTAYGRFWRRFPIPDADAHLDGESWTTDGGHKYVNKEPVYDEEFVGDTEAPDTEFRYTFDQLAYVIDQLQNNPKTRRMVVTAWHPANASESTLPPCHYTFVFSVQDDTLNLHLTQRSGDTALGVPFNIAGYSLLLLMVANETGFTPGEFGHSIVDAHIYCGSGDRGDWYGANRNRVAEKVARVQEYRESVPGRAIAALKNSNPVLHDAPTYTDVADWIESTAPAETDDGDGLDHVPGLLRQLDRPIRSRPSISIADKSLDELTPSDIEISEYNPHPGISFGVAE